MTSRKTAIRWYVCLAVLGGTTTLFRLYMAGHIALSPDEAYYYQWSTSLSFSYPDHPPLVAWLIRGCTALLGETRTAVRLFAVLGALVQLGLVYRIARDVGLAASHAVLSAMLSTLLIAPASAALIMTPDTPLGLMWLAVEWVAIRFSKHPSDKYWYLLALLIAVAILSKYEGGLLLLLVVLMAPGRRRSVHPLLALLVMIAVLMPHLMSEWRLGFPAGRFQENHLLGRLPSDGILHIPERLLALFSGQVGLLTPLVAWWVWRGLREGDPSVRVLTLGVLLPLLATAVAACFTHPEQNWASLGHPGAAVLAVRAVVRRREGSDRRRWMGATFASALGISALIHIHVLFPFLPLSPTKDPTARLHGWHALDTLLPVLSTVDAVVADNYGLAAELKWRLRHRDRRLPIYGADREAVPRIESALLLDQTNDFAKSAPAVVCEKIHPLKAVSLQMGDRGEWDRIGVSKARGCRPIDGNGVVSQREQ